MACDICGSNKSDLVDLLKPYQTDDIKQICRDCEKVVNGKNSSLMSMVLKIKRDSNSEHWRRFRRGVPTIMPTVDTIHARD